VKLPDVTIVTTTWFPDDERGELRFESAKHAVNSWRYIQYAGYPISAGLPAGDLRLHIADDGSQDYERRSELLSKIWERASSRTMQNRRGVGASLNKGFDCAFSFGEVALYLVDDWMLDLRFDISPWVHLLMENESIGMVRLGLAHPDLTGAVKHSPETGKFYLRLDRHHFAFAHRPALYHKRFFDAYGPFDENVNAFECERMYNERFCAEFTGPDIALALLHPWRHISDIELADVEPSQAVRV
jgi:hypothetical protein